MILTILAGISNLLLPSSVCLGKLEFRGGISGGNAATCKGVSVVSDRGAVENRKTPKQSRPPQDRSAYSPKQYHTIPVNTPINHSNEYHRSIARRQ